MLQRLITGCILALALGTLLSGTGQVIADGGPVAGSSLWPHLTEGHQVAVISVKSDREAKIDLFISLLDQSQESHEIVFFLPLGLEASGFLAREKDITSFSRSATDSLDQIIRNDATSDHNAQAVLFGGSILANGFILAPLWAPMLLSGCAGGSAGPLAEYETASSQIDIFEISQDTNLGELVATAGLPPQVTETLKRLEGQQIAVVRMHTQPDPSAGSSSGNSNSGERGIHFTWKASLSDGTFAYALGTGSAWSNPVEMTRVYIVAPPGLDFDVEYPRLGSNQSGYSGLFGQPHISSSYDVAAYAIDESRGDFGRVWRAIYTQSNSSEDIMISVHEQSWWSGVQAGFSQDPILGVFIFGIVLGPVLWVVSWKMLMPRLVGAHQPRLQWYWAFIYPAINAFWLIFPGLILFLLFIFGATLFSIFATFILFGGIGILTFWLIHGRHFTVGAGKSIRAFLAVSAAGNIAYFAAALAFAAVTGIA